MNIDKQSEKLKTGDVVVLKSGGQPMTITGINDYGKIACAYWSESELRFVRVSDLPKDCVSLKP